MDNGLNKRFFIKELPGMIELFTNTIQGLTEGMAYLFDNNYKIMHETSTIIGINYIIYAKKESTPRTIKELANDNQKIIELEFKAEELQEIVDDYDLIIEDRDLGIEDLNSEIKYLKSIIKKIKTENTKIKNKLKKDKKPSKTKKKG